MPEVEELAAPEFQLAKAVYQALSEAEEKEDTICIQREHAEQLAAKLNLFTEEYEDKLNRA